uniref:Uncharacterized protein n=1 Tax=Catagonus wagneri TaxID=51154 RepID=A0A8C3VN33_9CETA
MLPRRIGFDCSRAAFWAFPFPGARRGESLCATQPRRALCQVCTADEARSARKQRLLLPLPRRLPALGLCNCYIVPELNSKRESRGGWAKAFG